MYATINGCTLTRRYLAGLTIMLDFITENFERKILGEMPTSKHFC